MALDEYRRKRKFTDTPEPKGQHSPTGKNKKKAPAGAQFVVQHHRARREHYDFRLEMDGVLKSWAVPKGPSYDTRQKHLAVETEDHPLEYGSFEGLIPQGQYGAGPVLLWDRGTWQPLAEDPLQAYRDGMIKFELHGEKLRGRWALIRMRDRSGKGERNWLLIKERDEYVRPQAEFDVTAELRESVVSQRTIEQIAADGSEVKEPVDGAEVADRLKKNSKVRAATRGRMPESVEPMLATLTRTAPRGDQWIHEIKFDGYRMVCHRRGKTVKFVSRRDNDWTSKMRSLVPHVQKLPGEQFILDGEVVVLTAEGISSFQALQNALGDAGGASLVYYVFDLLYFEGRDLRKLRLDQRKELLRELLAHLDASNSRIRYSDHIEGEGPHVLKQACGMGVEGVISKRRDRPYRPGRSSDWLKSKCLESEEFVVGGFTRPSGTRTGFGALLLGHYEEDELIYIGRVGTGFNEKTLRDLHQRLKTIEIEDSPFANLTRRNAGRDAHFVKPELVAEVEFGSWTNDGLLRHTAFRGLREDKAPEDISSQEQNMPTIAQQIEQNSETLAAELEKVRFTHPQRVMYPDVGFTKLGVAAYYAAVADWILPHIVDRPLTLVRCPQGVAHKCFYQKHDMPGLPETVDRLPIEEQGGVENYLAIRDLVGLLTLVQFSILEIHLWGSRRDNIEKPDRLIFDLDPDPSVPWSRVVDAAGEMRRFLEELGLQTFLKTTGGKGLHVVLPIRRTLEWPEAKQFCKNVAEQLMRRSPQHYTTNASKAARRGKIYVDYLRNGRGATAIAAYSTRARERATVSVPLDWKELKNLSGPAQFDIENVPRRLAKLKRDPWEGIDKVNQTVTKKVQEKVAG